jgi:hypothetical protein
MPLSYVAIFIFALMAIAIIVFIITVVLKKNRGDLQKLKTELKHDIDEDTSSKHSRKFR